MKHNALFLLFLLFFLSNSIGLAENDYAADIELYGNEEVYSFTLRVEDGVSKKDYDGYLEYPSKFDSNGEAIEYERVGVGFLVELEIANHETDRGIWVVEYRVQQRTFDGWRSFSGINIRTPDFSGFSARSKVFAELNEWIDIPISTIGSNESGNTVRMRIREY